MSLEVRNISKSFGEGAILSDINLKVEDGEILAILGPSGSGKSTLLRIICGLEKPDVGTVILGSDDVTECKCEEREIGMIFQTPILYPYFNVARNLALGIAEKLSPQQREAEIEAVLELVDLAGFSRRNVDELSGGEAQRVALARALLTKPRALLMDEPFSALDQELRESLALTTRKILLDLKIPIIHVTHDQSEAERISDRVVNLDDLNST